MKINELMIGDYICLDGDVNYDNPIRIQQIGYQGENDIIADSDVFGVEDIIPIPLTEDILVKNGYKSTQGLDFYWLDDKKHCCIKNYDGKRLFCYKQGINDVWLVVKYVHTLQHLLRLCGIEKSIIL